jgi:pyridinium-3,5-biscarboxylic acid mononucleotide sulfurtransferase
MKSLIQIRPGATSPETANEKEKLLFAQLRETSSLLIALSGGIDSAYLAWAANQVLGERAVSVTALSPSYSAHDREQVESFVRSTGVKHEFIVTQEMENPAYRANNPDRCYYCKDELFSTLDQLLVERQVDAVAYGINADDTADFRPGHRAAREHRVLAPLLEAGLHKSEIRFLAQRAGLPSWDRPASACLASRLPYGTEVTPERLSLIERGEAALRALGFRQFRLRLHDKLARVEVAVEELPVALQPDMAAAIAKALKTEGFAYVTLDLEGYRQGSLNETLKTFDAGISKTPSGT